MPRLYSVHSGAVLRYCGTAVLRYGGTPSWQSNAVGPDWVIAVLKTGTASFASQCAWRRMWPVQKAAMPGNH